jgi:hypothetical protein
MSPTHIGFIGVQKNGSKISHLGTFKYLRFYNLLHFLVLANVGGVLAEGVELAVISAPCSSAG